MTDCFPLVYENCKFGGGNSIRQPDGTCVGKDECAEACDGEPGQRSDILGVCSCDTAVNVDEICNQDCRKKAPKVSMKSSYEIVLTYVNGETQEINLKQTGSVEGALEPCRAEYGECNIRSG